MRLSDVLSRPENNEFKQVNSFLGNLKRAKIGKQILIDDDAAGKVAWNFYCKQCGDNRTFSSEGNLYCILINDRLISIDCRLECKCKLSVPMWFLVESKSNIFSPSPEIRVAYRNEKLPDEVLKFDPASDIFEYSILLSKADFSFHNQLGIGAIVYLRVIYEKITRQTAKAANIEIGKSKDFFSLLKKVDEEKFIIPREFTANGYKLFRELSGVVHGNCDELEAIDKFPPLRRLIIGVLDNIKNNNELMNAIRVLGWENDAKDCNEKTEVVN